LVLVHKTQGRLIFAELKSEYGKVEAKQEEWLRALAHVWDQELRRPIVLVAVWRPSNIEQIEDILRN
jgi:hypothetical protein